MARLMLQLQHLVNHPHPSLDPEHLPNSDIPYGDEQHHCCQAGCLLLCRQRAAALEIFWPGYSMAFLLKSTDGSNSLSALLAAITLHKLAQIIDLDHYNLCCSDVMRHCCRLSQKAPVVTMVTMAIHSAHSVYSFQEQAFHQLVHHSVSLSYLCVQLVSLP